MWTYILAKLCNYTLKTQELVIQIFKSHPLNKEFISAKIKVPLLRWWPIRQQLAERSFGEIILWDTKDTYISLPSGLRLKIFQDKYQSIFYKMDFLISWNKIIHFCQNFQILMILSYKYKVWVWGHPNLKETIVTFILSAVELPCIPFLW